MGQNSGTRAFRAPIFLLEALAPANFLTYFSLTVLALVGTDC